MQLHDFDIEVFLREYWQKKPLLIKNALPAWDNPVEPDELAGLACEPDIESRLITRTDKAWEVENGPIPETRFGELGAKEWTLLVQAVDHYVPEVAALIEPFRFIPDWRIDDVMVSYAANGGGVGPHFDQYDVFLVQGLGSRRWQVGPRCDENTPLRSGSDLRQLAHFEVMDEWVLEPGDILYVPPGIAHNGTAVGDDCMTYSVGFRAPSRSELIGDFCDDLLESLNDDDRYSDIALSPQEQPGEISSEAIDRLHAMLTEKTNDRAAFAHWFGRYNSTHKYPDMDWSPDEPLTAEQLRDMIAQGSAIERNPASHFAFIRHDGDTLTLFADGRAFSCSRETISLAERICSQESVAADPSLANSAAAIELLTALYNQGSLIADDEE